MNRDDDKRAARIAYDLSRLEGVSPEVVQYILAQAKALVRRTREQLNGR